MLQTTLLFYYNLWPEIKCYFWLPHYMNQGRIHRAVFDEALFYRCFPCPCAVRASLKSYLHGTSQRCVVRHAVLGVNLLNACIIFTRFKT